MGKISKQLRRAGMTGFIVFVIHRISYCIMTKETIASYEDITGEKAVYTIYIYIYTYIYIV